MAVKKKNLGLWLSVTATIVSAIALGIVCFRWVSFPSTAESYLTMLVSLFALCVTFAIGYQIVNTLDLKESVREMRELKSDLEETKKEIKNVEYQINAKSYSNEAYTAFKDENYPLSICHCITGLKFAIKCDDGKTVFNLLKNMSIVLNAWIPNTENYDPSKFVVLLGNKKPIDVAIKYFDAIINECPEYILYDSHIEQIKEYKTLCEQKIKEHNEWVKNNPAKAENNSK